MNTRLPYKQVAYRSLTICLGSLLIGALEPSRALAETSSPLRVAEQSTPNLADLFNTIPVRPTVSQPAIESPERPDAAVTEPPSVDNAQTVRLRLSLSDRRVYVYRGESLETSYPVAIGRPGWETPTGEFSVFSQIVDPGWTHPLTGEVVAPGPENPLGERWIAFWTDGTNVIGFHGTPNRDSVGQEASHGCVRMYNEDVRQLYEIVAMGTPVTVEP